MFIADTGKAVWVWVGGGASPDEKKNAMTYAHVCPTYSTTLVNHSSAHRHVPRLIQNYLMKTKHPLVPVTCLKQSDENKDFDKIFS